MVVELYFWTEATSSELQVRQEFCKILNGVLNHREMTLTGSTACNHPKDTAPKRKEKKIDWDGHVCTTIMAAVDPFLMHMACLTIVDHTPKTYKKRTREPIVIFHKAHQSYPRQFTFKIVFVNGCSLYQTPFFHIFKSKRGPRGTQHNILCSTVSARRRRSVHAHSFSWRIFQKKTVEAFRWQSPGLTEWQLSREGNGYTGQRLAQNSQLVGHAMRKANWSLLSWADKGVKSWEEDLTVSAINPKTKQEKGFFAGACHFDVPACYYC